MPREVEPGWRASPKANGEGTLLAEASELGRGLPRYVERDFALPHVPYRQWTLSFPHRVRWVLRL